MNHLSINDYFSSSPSSLSSSSFSSNASDGTCTPLSYNGDNNSERSETPSSLTNISLNELTGSPSYTNSVQQVSTSPSKSNGGSYCGYVESYPYYYKLNRLYNALAIQKLQTEKFKKIMRNKPQQYSQQSSPASKSPSTTPAPSQATASIAGASTSIQIPKQQQRGSQKTQNFSSNRKSSQQQKSSPRTSTLAEAYSPNSYQQYHRQHLTPPQFITMPNNYYQMVHNNDLLLPNQSSIVAAATASSVITANDQTSNNANNGLFDTMNWLRGPDLVKSKN